MGEVGFFGHPDAVRVTLPRSLSVSEEKLSANLITIGLTARCLHGPEHHEAPPCRPTADRNWTGNAALATAGPLGKTTLRDTTGTLYQHNCRQGPYSPLPRLPGFSCPHLGAAATGSAAACHHEGPYLPRPPLVRTGAGACLRRVLGLDPPLPKPTFACGPHGTGSRRPGTGPPAPSGYGRVNPR